MITIDHLRDAWEYALSEINAAIFHLESGDGKDVTDSREKSQKAADAWLENLQHYRMEYKALLTDFPSVH